MGESTTTGSGSVVIIGGLGSGRDNGSGVEELRVEVVLRGPKDTDRLFGEDGRSSSAFAPGFGGLRGAEPSAVCMCETREAPSAFSCEKVRVIEGARSGCLTLYPGPPACGSTRWRVSSSFASGGFNAVRVAVFVLSDTVTGACVICKGRTTAGGVGDASSAASLSAASAAARSVLRSDDEALLLCPGNGADFRARNRELSRSTDSDSDLTDCSCFGNRKLSGKGKAYGFSGNVGTLWELEMSDGREVATVDGIEVAWGFEDVTGEVVKSADLAGGRLTGARGNESMADGGKETGKLLRIELGVCGREGAE